MNKNGPIEVALTSDLRGEPYSFSLWDVHTGAQLVVFKGNKANPIARCLKMIDKEYFITATDNLLQIWSIYNRKSQDQKLFLPGRPTAICLSPCGNYLIAGIAEMIYVWQLRSGNLLAHSQRHYQTVTILKMDQDGTFLFSGGEDGMVLVWAFADLISGTHNTGALNLNTSRTDVGINEPRFTWQNHDGPVTDIHVTNGGRCITSSTDKSINIYSYTNGKRLFSIAGWPTPIWCLAMNKNETRIFLGGQDGNIYQLAVSALGSCLTGTEDQKKPLLIGHKDKVNNVVISLDGTMLISASLDSTCKVWDLHQGTLIRDIKHQAPLANLATLIVTEAFSLSTITQSQSRPPLIVRPLKRSLYKLPRENTISKGDLFEEANTAIVSIKNRSNLFISPISEMPSSTPIKYISATTNGATNGFQLQTKEVNDTESNPNDTLVKKLKSRLRDLYLLSAEKLFQDSASETLQPFREIVDQYCDTKQVGRGKKRKIENGS